MSLAYTFDDTKATERHLTQYFDIFDNHAIYHDGWTRRPAIPQDSKRGRTSSSSRPPDTWMKLNW